MGEKVIVKIRTWCLFNEIFRFFGKRSNNRGRKEHIIFKVLLLLWGGGGGGV